MFIFCPGAFDDRRTVADSEVIRVRALGTNIVILNSLNAVNELLDKRSSTYSDR